MIECNNLQKLDNIDKSFDNYTVYTVVSTFSGVGRALFGLAELIYGVVSTIFTFFGGSSEEAKREFADSGMHVFFGGANLVKGILEAIPVVNFLIAAYNYEGRPLCRNDFYAIKVPVQET